MNDTFPLRLDELYSRFVCASATMHTVYAYLSNKDSALDHIDFD